MADPNEPEDLPVAEPDTGLADLLSGAGGLGGLLEQAQSLMAAAAAAADQVVEGQAGGGVVRIRVDGHLDFQQVHIDPSVLADGDAAMVEDLVLAALRDAVRQLGATSSGAGGIDPGVLEDLGGLGDIGRLLGGS